MVSMSSLNPMFNISSASSRTAKTHIGKVQYFSINQVDHPSWRRHNDLRTIALNLFDLIRDRCTAIHYGHGNAINVLCKTRKLLLDLLSQFSRRRKHNRLNSANIRIDVLDQR